MTKCTCMNALNVVVYREHMSGILEIRSSENVVASTNGTRQYVNELNQILTKISEWLKSVILNLYIKL